MEGGFVKFRGEAVPNVTETCLINPKAVKVHVKAFSKPPSGILVWKMYTALDKMSVNKCVQKN